MNIGRTLKVLLLLLAGGFFYFLATRENDPVYKGKRLSEHLLGFGGCFLGSGGGIDSKNRPTELTVDLRFANPLALEAVSEVGTNALPLLVKMLGAKDSTITLWIRSLGQKYAPLKKIPPEPVRAWTRKIGAVVALHELGSRAAGAASEIVPLLSDPDCALQAVFALVSVRPERKEEILSPTNVIGLNYVAPFRAPPGILHSAAIVAIGTFGPRAADAVPILKDSLTSTNERVRAASAVALARIGAPAEEVVPLIIDGLPKTNPRFGTPVTAHEIRKQIWALREYGRHGGRSLSALSRLEEYPAPEIQRAAKEAAAEIIDDMLGASLDGVEDIDPIPGPILDPNP